MFRFRNSFGCIWFGAATRTHIGRIRKPGATRFTKAAPGNGAIIRTIKNPGNKCANFEKRKEAKHNERRSNAKGYI